MSSIKSLKKLPARIYKSVAPILVEKRTINIPHHFPNINPPNKRSGDAKPKKRTHTIQKIKKAIVKNKKLFSLYC